MMVRQELGVIDILNELIECHNARLGLLPFLVKAVKHLEVPVVKDLN